MRCPISSSTTTCGCFALVACGCGEIGAKPDFFGLRPFDYRGYVARPFLWRFCRQPRPHATAFSSAPAGAPSPALPLHPLGLLFFLLVVELFDLAAPLPRGVPRLQCLELFEGCWQPSPHATTCPSPSSGASSPALPLHEVVLLLLLSVVESSEAHPDFGYCGSRNWLLGGCGQPNWLTKFISRCPISSSTTASAWFALLPFGCGAF